MIQAWILMLVFQNSNATITSLTFQTREQCIAAQKWHKEVYKDSYLRTSCYPSFVVK